MSERASNTWAGVAGIVGAILVLIGAFIAGVTPAADDPAAEIRDYLVDNRTLLLIGAFANLLVFPFIAWFIVVVRARLAAADTTPLPIVALATLFVIGGLSIVGAGVTSGAVYIDGFAEEASDDLLQYAWSSAYFIYASISIGFVVVLGAFGVSALRERTFPAWNAWLAIILAVVAIVGLIGVFDAGLSALAFVSFLAFVAWVVATSVALLMAGRAAPA